MHSSTRTNRFLAAATPVGVALVSVGTAVLVAGADAAIAAILAGILVGVVGLAGVHGLIADRYGGIGYAGFLVTQVAPLAVIAVWPAGVLLDALTPLEFAEALAVVFALPYAWLALAARGLPVAVHE